MTIARINIGGIGPRVYVPEGPYGVGQSYPLPSYNFGAVMQGDMESEFVFCRLGVTGALTMNQGDVLVWDQTFCCVQSATGAGAHAIGSGVGTFYLGGRVGELAGGPYALPQFQYTFPSTGTYGVFVQRYGSTLINCASTTLNAIGTTAVLGQVNTPATPLAGSMGVTAGWLAKSSFTFTATTASGSNVFTAVSTNAGLTLGQQLSGTGVPVGAYITDINGASVTMSQAATATGSGVTITAKDLATVGNTTSGSPVITNVPSIPVIYPNQIVTGTGIPASTSIVSIGGTPGAYTITLSNNATATGTAVALAMTIYVQAMLRSAYIGTQN